jgi:hypothetical protein
MKTLPAHRISLMAAALLAAACQMPVTETKPVQPAPQITEGMLRERAAEQLATGVKQYEAGEYEAALKNLTTALDHGLLARAEQARARKFLAFVHCIAGRDTPCRDEFRKAFEIYPDFSLAAAEDGHPIWGPVYRDVRTQLISEREASVSKPLIPLAKAEQALRDAMVKYDSGDYAEAIKMLEASLKDGLKEKADQVRAMKHVAFSLCLQEKYSLCRAEFVRIFDVDHNFDLAPAEAGHPSWTRTFAAAKAQAKKALQEKEAKEKAKAPPAAAVPAKK